MKRSRFSEEQITGPGTRWPRSSLLGQILSGPHDCVDLVQSL
jgi:hypothetical protein